MDLRMRGGAGSSRSRFVALLVALFVVGVVAGAAGSTAIDDGDAEVAASASTSSSMVLDDAVDATTSTTTASSTTTQPEGPVTLAFVGDINAEGSLADRLAENPQGFVGPFAELLVEADLAIGNLEAAITDGGEAVDKEYTFRVPPSILGALHSGGIDVVSLANNHGIDFGPEGLEDTLAAREADPNKMVIGIGADESDAYRPYVREVGGVRIAVIAATEIIDSNLVSAWSADADGPGMASALRLERLVDEVESAGEDADVVVVYLHWGVETEECPSDRQVDLAEAVAAAGADVVVGTHAHRVQGGGRLGDAVVHYGLGNFLFGAATEASARTGVLLVDVDRTGVVDYRWEPGRIAASVPAPLEDEARAAAMDRWESQRGCTGLEP